MEIIINFVFLFLDEVYVGCYKDICNYVMIYEFILLSEKNVFF